MGKWDKRNYARPRRRYYRDYNWSPPRDEPCPDPESEVWQDNVPMWEKKFCYLVGRMPWKKILSTKNFMHCHSNVLTWDDSAGEDAFNNAKKRFWDEFNGLPCETQSPNPDMYIDEINWNPFIDLELARELDRVYFNPDDKRYLPSSSNSKENNGWPKYTVDSTVHGHTQSSTVQDKATGWNHWNDSVDDTSMVKNNDPWESHNVQVTEIKDNSWGDACAWNTSWDSKKNDRADTSKNWRVESNTYNNGGTGWQDRGACSSYWIEKNNYRAPEFGAHMDSKVPNGRGNQWGKRQSDNYNCEVRGSGNVYRGRGRHSSGYRKRESPEYHTVNCKGPRVQGGDYQSPRYWNADNNKRVSLGGQWS